MTIKEIEDKINKKEYTILNEKIAIGTVYKIKAYGDVENIGIEIGYLYLTKNSGIREHEHTNDIEKYKLLMGTLKINGEDLKENICKIGSSHSIDIVENDTIIRYCKISKLYLEKNNYNNYTGKQVFNKVFTKSNRKLI